MNQTITITPRRLILLGIFGLMSVLTYGFAAANTVPASNAGDGSQAVSGYTVSAVHYGLDLNTPSNIATLTFTVTPGIPATGAVRVSVVTPPSAYWPAAACSFVPRSGIERRDVHTSGGYDGALHRQPASRRSPIVNEPGFVPHGEVRRRRESTSGGYQ
ncbi:MAG: hypothetical protein IPO51_11025 [Dehalococcoidia bacterium]|nr:hypothetical protein [Dehalococcoidia bacterium]